MLRSSWNCIASPGLLLVTRCGASFSEESLAVHACMQVQTSQICAQMQGHPGALQGVVGKFGTSQEISEEESYHGSMFY